MVLDMKKNKTYNMVLTGLFAALCCVATFIHIPAFATNGYVNLGDCFVIVSGLTLGPLWGAAAGGIGSVITDLLLGYVQYAPATLIIKALMAFFSALIYRTVIKALHADSMKIKTLAKIISAVFAEIIMVTGYLLFEGFCLGYGWGAAASMPGNLLQAAAGIVISVPACSAVERIKF